MALFGGSKSASTTNNTTNQTDNRRVLGEGSISAENSSINIQTLDGEVVNRAFSFGSDSLDFANSNVGKAFNFGGRALDYATEAQAKAAKSMEAQGSLIAAAYSDAKGRGALTDKILIGAVAMAGLVALFAIKKS